MSDQDRLEANKYKDMYFEEKFSGVNARLDAIIKNQEAELKDRDELWGRLEDLEDKCMICPIADIRSRVDNIEKDLVAVRVLAKYPKLAGVSLIGVVVVAIVVLIEKVYPLIK